MSYNFFNPTRVLFGAGELNNLHKQAMPGKKAMVVISNGKSTRENGTLDRTLEQLRMAGVETAIFDKVEANPLKSTVEAGAKFAKDNGCDFVVALGGVLLWTLRRLWLCMHFSLESFGTMLQALLVRCNHL